MTGEAAPLLEIRNLVVEFGRRGKKTRAVDNVSFIVNKGETFGIVGESGSGKTTIGRSIIRLNPTAAGDIIYKGKRINGGLSTAEDKQLTREIQMIFQDPMSSLNERAKVDYLVGEGLYNSGMQKEERRKLVMQSLRDVGLRTEFAGRFPHEFSGGQRQRIGIARCMVMQPELIVADEPISALDVSIRAQVLNLMSRLQRERGLTYIFISHDLSVMRFICDRIACLHKGVMVELADTETLYQNPVHPYTKALLSAIPEPDPDREKNKTLLTYNGNSRGYSKDKLIWSEIEPGHFVNGTAEELAGWVKESPPPSLRA